MTERKINGQFTKGVSGNPGGRPKDIYHVRELARQYTDEAVNTLAEIANNPKSPPSARVQAANALLDRAWGKPVQFNENATRVIEDPKMHFKLDLEERIELLNLDILM